MSNFLGTVQSLNYQLRKVTKNRSIFVNDDSILKLMYLALRNASEKWTMPIKNWRQALNQFAIEFGKELTSVLNDISHLHKIVLQAYYFFSFIIHSF